MTILNLKRLEGELTGLMRRKRGLRPLEESNFALNRSEMVSDQLGLLFDQLSFIGFLIGLFAMLVGGFGIANIMFVSVKERTSIIGIQKSLGAKNYFVLWQFLFEAVFLSIIGGVAGLYSGVSDHIHSFGKFSNCHEPEKYFIGSDYSSHRRHYKRHHTSHNSRQNGPGYCDKIIAEAARATV